MVFHGYFFVVVKFVHVCYNLFGILKGVFVLKTLQWKDTYTDAKMRMTLGTYMANPSCMAISLLMTEGGDYPDEPYGNLTVNLADNNELLPKYHAYIDVNNMPEAADVLSESGLAMPTGDVRRSGFVTYPLYEFNKDVLAEYVPAEELVIYENSYARFERLHRKNEPKTVRRQIETPDMTADGGLSHDDVDLFSLI